MTTSLRARTSVVTKVTHSVFASQLKTIRLVCNRAGCGGVIEVPVATLAEDRSLLTCPGCNKENRHQIGQFNWDHLKLLDRVLQAARDHAAESDIEFVIAGEAAETK